MFIFLNKLFFNKGFMGLISSNASDYKKYTFCTSKDTGCVKRLAKNLHILFNRICYFFKHGEFLTRSLIGKKLSKPNKTEGISKTDNVFHTIHSKAEPKALSQAMDEEPEIFNSDEEKTVDYFKYLFQQPDSDVNEKAKFIQKLDFNQIVDLAKSIDPEKAASVFAFYIEQLEQSYLNLPDQESEHILVQLGLAYSYLSWADLIDKLNEGNIDQKIYQTRVESLFTKEVVDLSTKQAADVYHLLVGDAPNLIAFCKKLDYQLCCALLEAQPDAANELSFNSDFIEKRAAKGWEAILEDLLNHENQRVFRKRLLKSALSNKSLDGLEFPQLLTLANQLQELQFPKEVLRKFLISLGHEIKLQFLSHHQTPLKLKSIFKKIEINSREDMAKALIELRKVNQGFSNLDSLLYKYLDRFKIDLISEYLLPEEKETLKIYQLIQTKPFKEWLGALPKLSPSTHHQVINHLIIGDYSLSLKNWKLIFGTIKESETLYSLLAANELNAVTLEAISYWIVLKLKSGSHHLNHLEQTDALKANIRYLETSASPIDRALYLLLTSQTRLSEERAVQGVNLLSVEEIYTLSDEVILKLLLDHVEALEKLNWSQLIALLQKGLPLKIELAKSNLAALFKKRHTDDIMLLDYEQARYLFQVLNSFKGDLVFGFSELKLIFLSHLKKEIFAQFISKRVLKTLPWIDLLPLLKKFRDDLDPESVISFVQEKKLMGITYHNKEVAIEILTFLKSQLNQEKRVECEELICKLTSIS